MATVILTRLLDPASGGRRNLAIEADTVREMKKALLAEIPELEVHLFEPGGDLRPHVLCFVDGISTRLDQPDMPIAASASIRFVQAVSGGAVD